MGITVSPASSSGGGSSSSGTLPVIPGTSVEREIYTDTGFSTGDYVYRYGAGNVGSAPASSGSYNALNFTLYNNSPAGTSTVSAYPISFSASDMIGPQLVPVKQYTGATVNANDVVLSDTDLSLLAPYNPPAIARLLNNNFAILYNGNTAAGDAATLYYKVVEADGTIVATGTVGTGLYYSGQGPHYDVCSKADGGFAVAYSFGSSAIKIALYDSEGNEVVAATSMTGTTYNSSVFNIKIREAPNGYLYISGTSSVAGSSTAYIRRVDPETFEVINYANPPAGSYDVSTAMQFEILSDNSIVIAYTYGGGVTVQWFVLSQSLSTINSTSFSSGSQYTFNPYIYIDPSETQFSYVYLNSSGELVVSRVRYSGSSWSSYDHTTFAVSGLTTASAIGGCPVDTTVDDVPQIGAQGVRIYYKPSTGNYKVINLQIPLNPAPVTSSSVSGTSTAIPAITTGRITALQTSGGQDMIAYSPTTNSMGKITSLQSYTIVNGQYYPPQSSDQLSQRNGYYLLGVATTTATAGNTGSIAINGTVALSSSYGTSSTPIGFNYSQTNKSGIASGNKGYVVDRVVTLTGLE